MKPSICWLPLLSCVLSLAAVLCACHSQNDQEDPLDKAQRLEKQGKYQEALEQHIWLHDHVLEVDPAYYGVRLSFALDDWVKLGREYPPAMEALKKIRDEKTSCLLKGEQDQALFHDVESINDHLDEPAATVELFKQIEAVHPEFAALVYDIAEEALVNAQEYALARKYLGDPTARFAEAQEGYESGLAYAKTSRDEAATKRAYESIFTGDVVRIITVLDKTGDRGAAQEIQAKALAVLDAPAIRNAVATDSGE